MLAHQAAGVVALAVAVLYPVDPRRHLAALAALVARRQGHAAVGGVHQRGPFGNVDMKGHLAAEELTARAHHGSLQSRVGKHGRPVRGTWRGVRRPPPFVTAVGLARPGSAAHGRGIGHAGDELPARVAQAEGAPVAVELEGCLAAPHVARPQPYHQEALGRDAPHAGGHPPKRQVGFVVAQTHALERYGLVAGVVKFHPAVEIRGGAHHHAHIRGHQLVHHKPRPLIGGEGSRRGQRHQACGRKYGQTFHCNLIHRFFRS